MHFSFFTIAIVFTALIPSFAATKCRPRSDACQNEGMAVHEQPRIKFYWLEQSRSQRILWLLEELNLSYELVIFHRDEKTRSADPELKKIHALGKSPVISITPPGSHQPVVIAESGFIIEYMLDHFSNGNTLLPERYMRGREGMTGGESEEWMRFRYFMHYAEGSLMSLMMVGVIAKEVKSSSVPFFIKPITRKVSSKIRSGYLDPNIETHFKFLEQQLITSPKGGKYLCGPKLTGADILMSFPLIAAKKVSSFGLTDGKYPELSAYVRRLEHEPKYQKSVNKIIEIEGAFEATF